MSTAKKFDKQQEEQRIQQLVKLGIEIGEVKQGKEDVKRISRHAGKALKNDKNGELMAEYRSMKKDNEEKEKKLDKKLGI